MSLVEAVTPATASRIGLLLQHLRTPLYRNGYLLMLSAAATSVIGVLYWALAVHFYPARVVGLNSAAISAVTLLSGAAQLTFTGALSRFVPVAGRATTKLVLSAYALCSAASVLAALVFAAGINIWSPELRLLTSRPLPLLLFTAAVVGMCIFSLQDAVIAGLRRTAWVPFENITFAIVKVILLIALASIDPHMGIYVAWMAPVVVALLPINYLIFRHFIPSHQAVSPVEIPSLSRALVRYVAGNYAGTVSYLASTALLPIIVTTRAGPRANAHFYLAWVVGVALQMIIINLCTSLTVEGARDEQRLDLYCYRVCSYRPHASSPPAVAICS
jgi:O-antigen/teichoic acid export membrane protein